MSQQSTVTDLNTSLAQKQAFVANLEAKIEEYENLANQEEAKEKDKIVELTKKLKAISKIRKDLTNENQQIKNELNLIKKENQSGNQSIEESSKIISELQVKNFNF